MTSVSVLVRAEEVGDTFASGNHRTLGASTGMTGPVPRAALLIAKVMPPVSPSLAGRCAATCKRSRRPQRSQPLLLSHRPHFIRLAHWRHGGVAQRKEQLIADQSTRPRVCEFESRPLRASGQAAGNARSEGCSLFCGGPPASSTGSSGRLATAKLDIRTIAMRPKTSTGLDVPPAAYGALPGWRWAALSGLL